MTMTGKHIWSDDHELYPFYDSDPRDEIQMVKVYKDIMCKACGMIDDRKKKNETKKLSQV